MALAIKYNTGSITSGCCVRKGNYDIGINPNYTYGPTTSTGFWDGYEVPSGGFVTYQNKASQGPSIYSIASESDIVQYGKNLNLGGTYTTAAEVIEACSLINNIAFLNIDYPEIPLNNNLLTLDAGYTASYPWAGAYWYNITGGSPSQGDINGTLVFNQGTSQYNNSNAYLRFTAAAEDAMVFVPAFAGTLGTFTVNIWINVATGNGYDVRQNVIGQQYSNDNSYAAETNCNFLIRGNGTNGYEGLIRNNNTNYTVDFGTVNPGAWRMLTLTYEGSNLSAYLDSALVGQQSIGAGLTNSNGLQTIIGGTTNGFESKGVTAYFDGSVGVANIYDTVLNLGEITQLYDNYKNPRNYT